MYELTNRPVDVAPTLLGMLRINYIQNNLGIDLLKEERPCMFFSADNMLGVKDTKHFYIYDTESKQEFNYNIHNGTLSPATANTTFDSLKTYASVMISQVLSLLPSSTNNIFPMEIFPFSSILFRTPDNCRIVSGSTLSSL